MNDVRVGAICSHYKRPDSRYRIIGRGMHTETMEELVLYEQLYDHPEFKKGTIWCRPKANFLGIVEVEGKKVPRFECVENSDVNP